MKNAKKLPLVSKIKSTLLFAIAVLLLIAIFYIPIVFEFKYFYIRIALLFLFIWVITVIFVSKVIRGKLPNTLKNIALMLYTIFFLFAVSDIAFMFIPRSNGVGFSWSSRIWFKWYWKPLNSFGYRDTEPDTSKRLFLFVGDSFTAGHGTKDVNDRFSNIFQKISNPIFHNIQSVNIGKRGSDTREEFFLLENFLRDSKIKPEYIILQYFGNDIEPVAHDMGFKYAGVTDGFVPYDDINKLGKFFVLGSYTINYFYWLFPHIKGEGYLDYLSLAYANENIFNQHKKDLLQFKNYCSLKKIPLVIVIFPLLENVKESKNIYINCLSKFFEESKISFIDLSDVVERIPPKDRIVNNNDQHPGLITNKEVANALLSYFRNKLQPSK
jgi:hypothetical protein